MTRTRLPRALLAGLCLISATVAAASPITLEDAVRTARQHSPMLLESRARSDAARQGVRQAQSARLPSLEMRTSGIRTDSPADAFGLQFMQERFSFPAFASSDPNNPSPLNNYALEFQAGMPVFTGGKLGGGIRAAGRMAQAASGMSAHTGRAVDLAVAGAYLNVLLADRAAALARNARETTARHVEQAEAFFDAGMIVESDLLQARVQLARMDEGLIQARNDSVLARAGLSRAMGVDQTISWDPAGEVPEVAVPDSTLEEALHEALAHRADIQAVQAKTGAAAAAVTVARGELLPEIGIFGKYSLNDSRFLGSHGSSFMLGASARWTLWNWGGNYAGLSRSLRERTAAEESERGYREQVEFEVRKAWQDVETARARRDVASAAVASAGKALTILEDRFSQGVARMTDLLDAETMFNESRLRDLQARFDLQTAIRTLRFAAGGSPVPEVS